MMRPGSSMLGLCGVLTIATSVLARPSDEPQALRNPIDRAGAIQRFQTTHPDNGLRFAGGNRVDRVYGQAFSGGISAEQSAEQFKNANIDLWGIAPNDLVPVGPFEDGRHQVPLMYNAATGTYKF